MTDRLRILLVEDDPATRRTLTAHLTRAGDAVDATEGRAAPAHLEARAYDLVIADARSAQIELATLHAAARARSPEAAVVPMSAFASVEHVTAAIREGVYDYLLKPVEAQHVAALLCRVRDRIAMRRRLDALRGTLSVRDALAVVMSGGPSMTALDQRVREVAARDTPVLIVGEAGTGRRLVASAIHALSTRAEMPLVHVECASDPARLAHRLFGPPMEQGLVASARGGTLVLEAVESLSKDLRAKVLAAVQRPDGPRVIAVSTGIPSVVARRGELLAWVRGAEIVTPALRERREDIPRLAEHYARLAAGSCTPRVAPEAVAALIDAPWVGNLPTLERVMREAVARAAGSDVITRAHLPPELSTRADIGSALVEQVEAYERAVVRRALETAHGAVARAARELGVPERTLRRKMRHFGIAKESFRKRVPRKRAPVSVPHP